jgi:DNA primase
LDTKTAHTGNLGQRDCRKFYAVDQLVFVAETAVKLRLLLQEEGLESWSKVTGGKGLHVMAPIERCITHDAARISCKRQTQRLAATDPGRYTIVSSPARRENRIFIDYQRNGRGNTAIGTYSSRARPGFPIAAPVSWAQVERGMRSDAFTIEHPFPPAGGYQRLTHTRRPLRHQQTQRRRRHHLRRRRCQYCTRSMRS